MYTSINSNALATQINNVYNRNQSYMNAALTKAATGQRINSAKDSPADWSISERMRERINSLNQVNQNVQNDNALLKTASGGIQNDIDILKTLKERALNSANASTSDADRAVLQAEVKQLIAQIDTNASSVKFNGTALLQGLGDAPQDSSSGTKATYYGAITASLTAPDDSTEVTISSSTKLGGVSSATDTLNWVTANGKDATVTWTDAAGTSQTSKISDLVTDDSDPTNPVYDSIGKNTTVGELITKLNDRLTADGAGFQLALVDSTSTVLATNADGDPLTLATDMDTSNDDTTDTLAASLTNGGVPGIVAVATTGTEASAAVFSGVSVAVDGNAIATFNTTRIDQQTITKAEQAVDPSTVQDTKNKWFQVGADSGVQITFNISNMQSTAFGSSGLDLSKIDVSSADKADASIQLIDQALTTALAEAAKLGSLEQRLGYTADNVATQIENMEASDSAIRDADMAKEMTNYMKYMVLSQASQYMLAQANQNGFSVLNLFQQ